MRHEERQSELFKRLEAISLQLNELRDRPAQYGIKKEK
jgi:hypothetical protein